jgi:3-methyladenine DNA glycosylase AlkD
MNGEVFLLNKYVSGLRERASLLKNSEEAAKLSRYMRDQFMYFGLRAPEMKQVWKEHLSSEGLPKIEDLETIIQSCWACEEREMQVIALYILDQFVKDLRVEDIKLLEYMITTKAWWDTIDHIAKKQVGGYFLKFPEQREQIINKWLHERNIWLLRSAILFQLGYKEKTDEPLLKRIIVQTKDTNEFFVDKAIGWALREYSKFNRSFVNDFLAEYEVSELVRRETKRNWK